MNDSNLQHIYFIDAAHASLVDAENYLAQGRKARAQESLNTARYFGCKCNNSDLVSDFEERLKKIVQKLY